MRIFSTRLVVGMSAVALSFAGLTGIGTASADSGSGQGAANQTSAPKVGGEKRKHRHDRKVGSLGSISDCSQSCTSKSQLVQHFNNYGFNEGRIFINPGTFTPGDYS